MPINRISSLAEPPVRLPVDTHLIIITDCEARFCDCVVLSAVDVALVLVVGCDLAGAVRLVCEVRGGEGEVEGAAGLACGGEGVEGI